MLRLLKRLGALISLSVRRYRRCDTNLIFSRELVSCCGSQNPHFSKYRISGGGLAEVRQGEMLNNNTEGSERGSSNCESGDVETDGSRCDGERDAPGQSCVYIPPGDHRSEAYRLGTFATFPKDIPVKSTEFAMMGFYYTGYRDRVRCFSCGLCVENFVMEDSAFDHRWHRSKCLMVNGQETSNVPTHMSQLRFMFMQFTRRQGPQLSANNFSRPSIPGEAMDVTEVADELSRVQIQDQNPELILANIANTQHEEILRSLNLKKEEHRRKTFAKWPSYPCPNLPAELARDGFFYLGNLDRVQCFSCSGVLRNWAPGDVIREQHLEHSHHCRFANDMDTRNIPMTSQQRYLADEEDRVRAASRIPNENTREPPDPSPDEQRHLASYFPCTNAINPHMESLQRRIETFERWPQNRTRATPRQIATAGLFHLGDSDKMKCYYCNGGLQNWEYNDEPWTEHAKWFPGCEFVIRRKGVDFVKRITDMHPNLNRPTIRNTVSYQNFPSSILRHQLQGVPCSYLDFPGEDDSINNIQRSQPQFAQGPHLATASGNEAIGTETVANQPSASPSHQGTSSSRKRPGSSPAESPAKCSKNNKEATKESIQDEEASAQSCHHRAFPSGEENIEDRRLATFGAYADSHPVQAKEMAREGFFHTGVRDITKCFGCAAMFQNWRECNRFQASTHDPDCCMTGNNHQGNIPREKLSFEEYLDSTRSASESMVQASANQRWFQRDSESSDDEEDNDASDDDGESDSPHSSDDEEPPPCGDRRDPEAQDDLFELSRGA